MSIARELVFELLLISSGAKKTLSHAYSDKDWGHALGIANEQAITGALTMAMEELTDKSMLPSKPVLLQWVGNSQIVEYNTIKMGNAGHVVVELLRENGFPCFILKGAAVGRYYPHPCSRSSGDIDVWVNGGRDQVYDFVKRHNPDGKLYDLTYHHVGLRNIQDIHVEIHIWPSFLSSPLRNRRLHEFCSLHRPTMESDMPSLDFDRVFILLHCYRHICGHGVGLRQIMDYFYVLRQGFSEEERLSAVRWIEALGMKRFARGMMWVLQAYFGLEEQYLLMPVDEKEGRFIMGEVMQTGNMGHSDTRNWGSTKTPMSRFFHNLRRDYYLAMHYPHEALWQPFFSLWLYIWRFSKGLVKDMGKD